MTEKQIKIKMKTKIYIRFFLLLSFNTNNLPALLLIFDYNQNTFRIIQIQARAV